MPSLRYRVFLNPQSIVPVATFIILSYAQEFAERFNAVDAWEVRDARQDDLVVCRNEEKVRQRWAQREVPPR